ncbi:MAG: hypothetical protein JO025_15735 [Verrucomicrobia bacterium]|nr:hypothetical protein [Verrucomicrobiota bacterium]
MSADSIEKGYETSDIPFWPWVWFTIGFVVSLVVIFLGVLVFSRSLVGHGISIGRTEHAREATLDRFPHPQLQTNPPNDLNDYLKAKNQELTTYGWIDRKNGIVHIPIQQAMDRFLSRGAPVRPPDSGQTEIDMQVQKAGGAKILPPAAAEKPSPTP